MGRFIIKSKDEGGFIFNLEDNNGQIILTSETFMTKESCKDGIDSVQTNCTYYNRYKKGITTNNNHFFLMKTFTGQVIGKSEMFESVYSMEICIESVRRNGISKTIVED
jgi:uncharacterized protein